MILAAPPFLLPMDPRYRRGRLQLSRQTGAIADLVGFTFSLVPVALVKMSMTVDYPKLIDIDHLL